MTSYLDDPIFHYEYYNNATLTKDMITVYLMEKYIVKPFYYHIGTQRTANKYVVTCGCK